MSEPPAMSVVVGGDPGPVPPASALGTRPARALLPVLLALFAGMPVWAHLTTESAILPRLVVMAMLGGALASPGTALAALAALTPLAEPLGRLLGARINPGEALVLAFLAGWFLRVARELAAGAGRLRDLATPAGLWPAAWLAAAVAASVAVQLWVLRAAAMEEPSLYLQQLIGLLGDRYYIDVGPFRSVVGAVQALAGIGLFVAASTLVRQDVGLGRRLLVMTVAGASGVAALNVNRLLEVSLRLGNFRQDLLQHLQTMRTSAAFPDLNAAGSYLVLALCLSIGLVARSRHRIPAVGVTALVAMSLWLTGSRAALLAALAVLPALALVAAWSNRRARLVLVAILLGGSLALLPALISRVNLPIETGRSLNATAGYRMAQTRMAVRLFADHPVFGAGHGTFRANAFRYADPGVPDFVRYENAHNNYLQVLAELGIVGFFPFAWLVASVARRALKGAQRAGDGILVVSTSGGLVAFGITCLFGHPLLIQPVAMAFWIVLGLLTGLSGGEDPRPPGRHHHWVPRVTIAVVVMLLVTIPWRGQWALAQADLSHAGTGMSEWRHDDQGTLFRVVTGPAQFYVPTTATFMRLPVRLEEDRVGGADVSLSLDHRPANRVHVEGTGWTDIPMVLPRDWTGRRYRSVQLTVSSTGTDPAGPARVCLGQPLLTPSR